MLRILHVEDSEDDALLIGRMLRKEWEKIDFVRVEDEQQVRGALAKEPFDLILSDFQLPGFSGLKALEISRELQPEVPFIFVSGIMGEEVAIESLRMGATDYVLKDRPARLVPSVRRAIIEAEQQALNRTLQARLMEASRLQAVSTLSVGISHDFNNLLTIILGQASLLKLEDESPEQVDRHAETISRAAKRAADIVKQLMAFSQTSDRCQINIDLIQAVTEILHKNGRLIPATTEIEIKSAHDLPHVVIDLPQLEIIVTNLLTNSIESMPSGGKITVAVDVVLSTLAAGGGSQPCVCLKFSDTGVGMDTETRKHIFEPFYTTKERGHGTGLGLPAVYGLMLTHGGWIDVESAPGQGSTFSLFFPVPVASFDRKFVPSLSPVGGRQKIGKILVIEDEPEVSSFVHAILTREGLNVLVARDEREALALFSEHQNEIELAFSDIGLPVVDGITVCGKLKSLKPELKIILSSGYSPGGFRERIDELGIHAFLPKPYDTNGLVKCVTETFSLRTKQKA